MSNMTSNRSGILTEKAILLILVISAVVGAGSGVGAYYLSGERHPIPPPQTRDFYLFTDTLNFNESHLGIPHDIFHPDRITVNLGDTVTIHYYNLEDQPENHTFTMAGAPFWSQSLVRVQGGSWNGGNIILQQNQRVNITFVANEPGVFGYYCTLHQPTMTGYLVVIPP